MHILIIAGLILLALIILLSKKKKSPTISTVGSKFEKDVSDSSFDEYVVRTSSTTPVLIDFYANWCAPCHYLTPLLAEMAEEYDGRFLLAKVNTDENPELKSEYDISAIPTVLLCVDGEIKERFTGGKLEHSIRYTLAKHGIPDPSHDKQT